MSIKDIFKYTFIIIFIIANLFVWWAGFGLNDKAFENPTNQNVSGTSNKFENTQQFTGAHVYYLQSQRPKLYLKSPLAKMAQTQNGKYLINTNNPEGVIYQKMDAPVYFYAQDGELNDELKALYLREDASLFDLNSNIRSRFIEYHWSDEKEKIIAKENVVSELQSPKNKNKMEFSTSYLESYLGENKINIPQKVEGTIFTEAHLDQKILFRSAKLEVNTLLGVLNLYQDVAINRQSVSATGNSGIIYLSNPPNKLKYFSLIDDVVLKEALKLKDGTVIERQAYGEKLEGSQLSGEIVLTGNPRVIQQGEIITGNKITFFQGQNFVQVDNARSTFNSTRNKNE